MDTAWTKLRNPNCINCDLHKTAQSVCLIGRGPTPCDLMIVGEAPGFREDDIGKPFAGKAGEVLDRLLAEVKIPRERVFISNAVHCRPPENRTPSQKEVKACKAYLVEEIKLVKPKYVLLLGNTALLSVTGKSGITKKRGEVLEIDGVKYLPTFHPAAIMRNPSLEPITKVDFRKFAALVSGEDTKSIGMKWTLVDSMVKLRACIEDLRTAPVVTYDFETSWTETYKPDIQAYCIGVGHPKKQWLIPLNYPGSKFSGPRAHKVMDLLRPILTARGKRIIAHNGKFDNKVCQAVFGWRPNLTFDTLLASYVLDENSPHGLKPLAQLYFDAPDWDIPKPIDPTKTPLPKLAKYCATDVYYTSKLYEVFKPLIAEDKGLTRLFRELLMPVAKCFEMVETEGVYIDPDGMPKVRADLQKDIEERKKTLDKYGPKGINWNSTQQVAKLLYDDLGLEVLATSEKTGVPSTAEPIIKQLRDAHPVVSALLSYRESIKLAQFLDSWKGLMWEGRLHPDFLLHGTVTGRASCKDPNLQQVPRDTKVRTLITAPPGWVLLEVDYSQIEMRIAAHMSGDVTLKRAFQTGLDVHILTGSTVMGVPMEQVNKDQRKKAKAVNFGFLYGMGWGKFKDYAREKYDVIFTDKEAQRFRERFFDLYSGLPSWHERQRRLARKFGYVRTLTGRKRRLPEINSTDHQVQGDAERQAINSPVQGTASDLALFSLVRIVAEFGKRDVVRPVGTIHDAILCYVREAYVQEVVPRIIEIMEDMETMGEVFNFKLTVPIEVEAKIGPWGAGKVWERPKTGRLQTA